MGKSRKSKEPSTVKVLVGIAFIIVCAFVSAIIYNLTNGYTEKIKPFYIERENGYKIYNDKGNVRIINREKFEVHHYGGKDKEISVSLRPIKVVGDYKFYLDGLEYSWNIDVVRYNQDFAPYFDVYVDQEKNTVEIRGNLNTALKYYAAEGGNELTGLEKMSYKDMFCLTITSGKSSIELDCCIVSDVLGLTLSQGSILF